MDKSLGTLFHFWSVKFCNSHEPNPSPHPTNNVGLVCTEFFPSFNIVQGVWGREAGVKVQEIFEQDALFHERTQK